MRVRKCDGFPGAFRACTGNDHLDDACGGRTRHYGVPVTVITVVGEVDPDIDECR
jgi:hypothetical protein